MRQIKFRAFFKPMALMFYEFATGTEEVNRGVNENIKRYHEDENWAIMQFTGLLDKNGLQEVYEGDLIDSEGNIKGNIYENNEIYQEGVDCNVAELCTKGWGYTEKKLLKRGCRYAK